MMCFSQYCKLECQALNRILLYELPSKFTTPSDKESNKTNIIFRNPTLRSVRREADGGFLMRVVAARPIKKGKMK